MSATLHHLPLPPAEPEPAQRLRRYFEALSPATLGELDTLYAPDARFKDPFNEVQGVAAIRAVFEHMYRRLDAPRFEVDECLVQGDQAFLAWRFHCRFRGESRARCIRGGTLLQFDAQGRVRTHRDYWDAAEELYEQLPLIGPLMRGLKRLARRG